jgi:hypothetical protein
VTRLVALLAAIACLALTAIIATADDSEPSSEYADAVQRAYDLIRSASPPDTGPATEAVTVLTDGTGASQPEIIADLKARPPLYDDARARLSALLAALRQPVSTSDTAAARQKLHEVMSMSRYAALHRPRSLIDRFTQWLQDRIDQFLRFLFGTSGGAQPPVWWVYGAGLVVMAAVVFVLARAARGRFSQSLAAALPRPRPPADYFTEADRLALAGDLVGAIRALCAGVGATLAGEHSWEGSPLTVREIFQRAPDYENLRPLLLPFEAAVYGGRAVDQATYARAAEVAARFRPQAQVAA